MFHGQNRNFIAYSYGRLYNWYAISDANFCPAGWHVPSNTEWQNLVDYLGGESVAGGKLKETGTSHWQYESAATNEVGFTALPAGGRDYNGLFYQIRTKCSFWNISETPLPGFALLWQIQVSYYGPIQNYGYKKLYGASVRLIKNSTILTNGQTSTMTDNSGNNLSTICINGIEWMSQNCIQTHYNNGTNIPFAGVNGINFSNAEWAALTTPGVCAYNNDEFYV